jgi:hypothetical protein
MSPGELTEAFTHLPYAGPFRSSLAQPSHLQFSTHDCLASSLAFHQSGEPCSVSVYIDKLEKSIPRLLNLGKYLFGALYYQHSQHPSY